MTSTTKSSELVICSNELSKLNRLRLLRSADSGNVERTASIGTGVVHQDATLRSIEGGGKPKRTRISTKKRLQFVKDLLNKNPGKVYRLYELIEAMPPDILGKQANAVETLRDHLKITPEVSVWKEKQFYLVKKRVGDHATEDRIREEQAQQQTATKEDLPAAPPLYTNWFQFGYLCALVHTDIHGRNDVIPSIQKMYDIMCEIAKEAYK